MSTGLPLATAFNTFSVKRTRCRVLMQFGKFDVFSLLWTLLIAVSEN